MTVIIEDKTKKETARTVKKKISLAEKRTDRLIFILFTEYAHVIKFFTIGHCSPFFLELLSCIFIERVSAKESHSKISSHHNSFHFYVLQYIHLRDLYIGRRLGSGNIL